MSLKYRRTQIQLAALAIAIILTVLTFIPIMTGAPLIAETPAPPSIFNMNQNVFPYITPAAWIAFLLTLFWKGKIRAHWRRAGYDYDTFKLLARMRGSDTRIKILRSLTIPKNRAQLAKELGLDWRAVDTHIDILMQYNLVKEVVSVGTAKFLMITDNGSKVLGLLDNSKAEPK